VSIGALVIVASACTASASRAPVGGALVTYVRGVPAGISVHHHPGLPSTRPFAAWAAPGQLYIVVYGSGSCPPLPTSVRSDGSHRVTITTKEHIPKGDDACTDDLRATTSTVKVPKDVDDSHAVAIVIDGVAVAVGAR
jgi:hypothetical protein